MQRRIAAPPPSGPPEHGAQLAFGRTDLSALQRRLRGEDEDLGFSEQNKLHLLFHLRV